MKTLKHNKLAITNTIFLLLLSINFGFAQNSYSVEFSNGISLPMGDFKDHVNNGFNSSFTIHKKFCDNITAGLGTNYTSFSLHEKLGGSNHQWSATSINIGPTYSLGNHKLFVDIYGKLGISFVNVPEIKNTYANSEVLITSFEKTNTTDLNTRFGINMGVKICDGLYFNVNTEYTANHQNNIYYNTRNISKAVDATGNINADLAENISFEQKKFSFSAMNINFGLVFNLNNSPQSKATSHNASRSNRSNNVANPNDGNNINNGTKATDYNSSRSNKADGVKDSDDDNDETENAKATSHNASRSNRSNNIANPNDGNDINNGTKATDYNSSRSNKADGIKDSDDHNDNEDNNTKVTD